MKDEKGPPGRGWQGVGTWDFLNPFWESRCSKYRTYMLRGRFLCEKMCHCLVSLNCGTQSETRARVGLRSGCLVFPSPNPALGAQRLPLLSSPRNCRWGETSRSEFADRDSGSGHSCGRDDVSPWLRYISDSAALIKTLWPRPIAQLVPFSTEERGFVILPCFVTKD